MQDDFIGTKQTCLAVYCKQQVFYDSRLVIREANYIKDRHKQQSATTNTIKHLVISVLNLLAIQDVPDHMINFLESESRG